MKKLYSLSLLILLLIILGGCSSGNDSRAYLQTSSQSTSSTADISPANMFIKFQQEIRNAGWTPVKDGAGYNYSQFDISGDKEIATSSGWNFYSNNWSYLSALGRVLALAFYQ